MPNLLTARHLLARYTRYMALLWVGFLVIKCASMRAQHRMQAAEPAAPDKGTKLVLPHGVQAILEIVQDVAPELHADALLALIESSDKLDRPMKIKFAREAAEEALQASPPLRMSSGVLLEGHDSAEGLEIRDHDRGLDRLSLLSRSVIDMAALDPTAAWRLAPSMLLPEMPPVGCGSALAYNPAAYYAALQAVSESANTIPGRSKSARVDLLAPAVNQLQTHTQVTPTLKLLSEPGLSTHEREVLTDLFLNSLARLTGDRRGFTAEMLHAGTTGAAKLYQILEAADPGSGLALLKGYRAYLVSNYSAGGCAELWDSLKVVGIGKGSSLQARVQHARSHRSLPDSVDQFNVEFRDPLTRAGLGPIHFSEIDGQDPGEKATIHEYQNGGLQLMKTAAERLRFDPQDEYQSRATRMSDAWRAEAMHYLESVDDWQGNPSNPLETAHVKNEMYTALIDLAPQQQDLRLLAIDRDLSMIENCGLENENPSAWMELMLELEQTIPYDGPDHAKQVADPGFATKLIRSPNASVRLIGLLSSMNISPFSSGHLPK